MSRKIEWARYSSVVQPYPTVMHFSDWLSDTANLICRVQEQEHRDAKRRVVLHAIDEQRSSTLTCCVCQGDHKLPECKRFLDASVAERWKEVKRLRLCFGCLSKGHSSRNCRLRRPCPSHGCKRTHHQLLHESTPTRSSAEKSSVRQGPQRNTNEAAVLSCVGRTRSSKLLFRILPVTLHNGRKSIDTYALFDEGSSVTMIDESLAVELGLRGEHQKLNVQWFGGHKAQEPSKVVSVLVSGTGMKKKHKLSNVFSVCNLSLPSQSLSKTDIRSHIKHMKHLPLLPYSGASPRLLIGLDHCHLGIPTETMRIQANGPYAANTELGWTVFGPTIRSVPRPTASSFVGHTVDQSLENMVCEYFETENFGVKPSPPIEGAEDARARSLLISTTRRVDGRYEVGLLWKRDCINMPESYSTAFKRLVHIEKRMQRDLVFPSAYREIINSYIDKDYAHKISPDEASLHCPKTWYLPHFAVTNPNKPGKLRLVFDAAAESYGVSLNSELLKGPQEYRSLPSVLFHFREGAIGVCGDIREMFHQIRIREEDRCAQRFLWRDGDNSREPDVLEMKVMTFGAACSPCAAQYVKTLNALEYQTQAPRAVQAILERHYVDDFVDSFDNEEEATEVAQKVRAIHKQAGFDLRNFTSNSDKVLAALGGTATAKPIMSEEGLTTEKVLGIFWQPSTDSFKFRLKFHNINEAIIVGERRPTKREMLSILMSIFDPLGFISHITTTAKLLIREIWKRKLSWDDPLSDDLTTAWRLWRQNLSTVTDLEFPRFYFQGGRPGTMQLHVFVDASEQAFAAVAYWRTTSSTGKVNVAFICSKSRCAPLKLLTIPRLELQAAVLGTRLMQTIREQHSVSASDCILWTDSKTVLNWIGSEHRRYKPFVAHRVAEILSATTVSDWRWVPTDENVADEATRAKRVECEHGSRWLCGPAFLRLDEEHWPKNHYASDGLAEDNEELRQKYALAIVSQEFINYSRFSSYNRLVRALAWVTRFVSRCRHGKQPDELYGLTAWEIETAKHILYRWVQEEAFCSELRLIERGLPVPRFSVLHQLTPYIGDHQILRVRGRIDAAEWLPISTRRPVILPSSHLFTKLVVSHHHNAMKHQNSEATICEIRSQFWIPRLRKLLRSVIANCPVCRIAKAAPVAPIMGPLPVDRLTPYVRPFTYTGLDYFGPINVAVGRRQEKRWVALFTCLTIRAIHLELAHDLSTDSCIVAIRNFTNRRGVPVRMRSDNGKNFVGANQEAKRFSEVFDCERLQGEMATKGVEWWFNCPVNPSEGGVWERMVQCVKRVLRHTLKQVTPREHTLVCFLIEAENIVNSRPLTHLPISADQDEPLTPNHFLLGSANTAHTPNKAVEPERLCALRKQWRIARQLRDHFWKRWIAEYLPTLTRRTKWCEYTRPLKVGDIVFICDNSLPRNQWSRGVVEQVHPGADGVVRQADVRTTRGISRRAASKLAVLDVEVGESG
ncbi:uncharacterized protein LOC118745966 [Rhagoletis pomonella]|uniref:uncharacterized protein LOC118745966 n=1 Tax=Rhagoletis pomonella TaxID=28610 RepID=UPI001787424A|nr:uncharacterized protein LOC118745966 [Rhagoletis pomonella]